MPGKFIYQDRIYRQNLRNNPDALYVFGDNLERYGMGGQAKQCRGEPNARGVPTKFKPSMDEEAFFMDMTLINLKSIYGAIFAELIEHMLNGGTVIWPTDGIGTGLAKLQEKAPAIFHYIEAHRLLLEAISNDQ